MVYLLQKTSPKETYPLKYSVLNDDTIKESQLTDFLRFDLEQKYASKYTLKFQPKNYIDKLITFNNPKINQLLKQILDNDSKYLKDDEVANGIHPHHDFINKKMKAILGDSVEIGDGIFGLTERQLVSLELNEEEKKFVKRYYSDTKHFSKYFGEKIEDKFIIYTTSDFKKPNSLDNYPNLKNHLNKFQKVITSDNKPYGLHRARKEHFFIGEKIAVQRKSPNEPVFTYLNFDSYLSAAFYVIKTNRFNTKYLTALLNSSLVKFWLRYKGKMQGDNFQVDKEPLVYIPIIEPENVEPFVNLVDYILYLKSNKDILTHTDNKSISSHIESILDMMVYELYFTEHMKEQGLNVLEFIKPILFTEDTTNEQKATIIKNFYEWYQEPENAVRQRMLLIETRSPDVLAVINGSSV
jgi:hypothetical protein